MATNRFGCNEGLPQNTSAHKYTQLKLETSNSFLNLGGFHSNFTNDWWVVFFSNYTYAVSFGKMYHTAGAADFSVISELYRRPQNSKIREKRANFVSHQVKESCENILLSKMTFNI